MSTPNQSQWTRSEWRVRKIHRLLRLCSRHHDLLRQSRPPARNVLRLRYSRTGCFQNGLPRVSVPADQMYPDGGADEPAEAALSR